MRIRLTRSIVGIVLLTMLSLVGSSPAAAQTKLVLATPHAFLFDTALPFYVAEEKGYFKEAGLAVERVIVRGGGENVQAVISGSVNIALATGFFSVLSAFQKGAPVKVLAAEMTGLPDVYWYVPAASPARKLDDLAGKRIGFSNPGSSTHMGVLAMIDLIKARGLPAPQALALGPPPDVFTAVKTGQADAGWSAPPLFLDRVEAGETRIVFRGAEIARFNDVTIRVTFGNADWVAKNPEAVRAFFKAYQKALDFVFAQRQEAARIWLKRGLKTTEALALRSWDFYTKTSMSLKPVKGVPVTIEDAIKFNFLKQPLSPADLDRLIDLSYVQ